MATTYICDGCGESSHDRAAIPEYRTKLYSKVEDTHTEERGCFDLCATCAAITQTSVLQAPSKDLHNAVTHAEDWQRAFDIVIANETAEYAIAYWTNEQKALADLLAAITGRGTQP